MVMQYPASLADLFDHLAIVEIVFDLGEALESSETGDGAVIMADYASRLWTGSCTLVPMDGVAMDAVDARLTALRRAGRPFMMTRPDRAFPAADPDGAVLGVATPTVSAVAANNRALSIAGLPAGYLITSGDFLAWEIGGIYHLHKVIIGGVDGADIEVEPEIRGNPVGEAVVLQNPAFKAVYVPGSYKPPVIGLGVATGPSFAFGQTLR